MGDSANGVGKSGGSGEPALKRIARLAGDISCGRAPRLREGSARLVVSSARASGAWRGNWGGASERSWRCCEEAAGGRLARSEFAAQARQNPRESPRRATEGSEAPAGSCLPPEGADSVGACLCRSEIVSDLGGSCPAPTAPKR